MASTEETTEKLLKLFEEYLVHQTMVSERVKHAEVIRQAKARLTEIVRELHASRLGFADARRRITAVYTMALTKIGSRNADIIEETSVQFSADVQPLFNP